MRQTGDIFIAIWMKTITKIHIPNLIRANTRDKVG